jgi:iron(III) transport system substrate-binding protein
MGRSTNMKVLFGSPCRLRSLSLALAAVAALLVAAPAHAQDLPEAVKKLLPQAKQEGAVIFFNGSTRIPQSQMNEIGKAFAAKFGFPLTVTVAALGSHAPFAQRLQTEFQRGVTAPVDIDATTARLLKPPRDVGAIEPVDWAAFGIARDKILPTNDGFLIRTIPRTVTYNTRLVKSEEAPHRLTDLADPKWKGKIVAPAFGGAFAYFVPVLGEQAALDLVRKLVKEQQMTFARSFTDVVTKVANGEAAIGYSVSADLAQHKRKGAPIANAPLEKVSGANVYGAVLKNAPHPAAGKVFLYFICCTPEGRKIAADYLNLATFDTPGTEEFEVGGEGRGVLPSVDWMMNDEQRISMEIEKILGM